MWELRGNPKGLLDAIDFEAIADRWLVTIPRSLYQYQ
jgi:hypothetical protein